MAIGLSAASGSSDGGSFMARAQYDARSGRWKVVNRALLDGAWSSSDVRLSTPFQAVFDFDALEVGWIKFGAGVDFQMTKIGSPLPPRPAETLMDNGKSKPAYSQGMRVHLFLKEHGLREWAATARCVLQAFDKLHDAYVAQEPANRGKVPVVMVNEGDEVKVGQSTNYAPAFDIVKWIDRPAEMAGSAPATQQRMDIAPPAERRAEPVQRQESRVDTDF